ncbi:hypothetical protein DSCO28_48090 [Desulfosarcina ovata subsp. sediminis]|uniref:NADP-dependent oxidoreductase domain-containing protein n=1 Tax=Desulfosarcina ovata subsp. sediminis TaxID=885957 RepID=A0A5K7ZVH2_9BACT|nr:hypothetical protein DSCO28_48090 [Desulfosarcina ovata subsp. sediminis]
MIIGAKTPEQLAENLASPDVTLTEDEVARLKAVSDLPAEYPGWMLERQAAFRFPEPPADA